VDNTLALIILCYIISHPMTPIITQDKEDRFNQFAFHYRLYPFLALLILFFIVINILTQLSHRSVYASSEYSLPYPGILPNHRLYPLKAVRDRLIEFFTRDMSKKAELYLLYADKRIYMAQMLAEQKDWELAEETASKAEKYLLKVRDSAEASKQMGGAPDVTFSPKIKQAAAKHQQVLKDMIKKSPKEQQNGLKSSQKINSEFASWTKAQ